MTTQTIRDVLQKRNAPAAHSSNSPVTVRTATQTRELSELQKQNEQHEHEAFLSFQKKLHADLEKRGLKPITEAEAAAARQEEIRKMDLEDQARFKPDYKRMGLLESDMNLCWADVKEGYSDGFRAMQVVKEKFKSGHGLVYLYGTYGQAKSLIGKILTVAGFKAGKRAAYANISGVLDDIRLAFDERENKATELIRRMEWWQSRDILFIDELDKGNNTDWAQERIFQLLDGRYQRAIREEALTVIASNKKADELDGYIMSRLKDSRLGPVLELNGPDGRQVMPAGWKH
jgi:DNA replication protein DnaC